MKACKNLDYSDNYINCEIKTAEPYFPEVRYWERKNQDENIKVQFCGKGRGRINGVFQCHNGEMSCYDPES